MGRRSRGVRRWLVVGAGVVLVGVVASVVIATSIARTDGRQSRAHFLGSAQTIAATVGLGIQHGLDLLVSADALLRENPRLSPRGFRTWAADMRVMQRYPDLIGIAEIVVVPGNRLAQWKARLASDPPYGRPMPFELLPPGHRPFYCLLAKGVSRTIEPLGIDYCALAPSIATSAADGVQDVSATTIVGDAHWYTGYMPLYRGGTEPKTDAARRAAWQGFLVMAAIPKILLDQALAGHPGTRLVLMRGTDSVTFTSGAAPRGARTISLDLGAGSRLQVSAAVTGDGIFANANAAGVLVGGVMLSFLLAALLISLGTSRTRALRLVEEKTRQLSFQAVHDGLTGLPNRTLVLDRAGQALARARRTQQPVAALFVDIDGFKVINDTFGHAAGDATLQAIAARLAAGVRACDTVGRLGGDEFVVLLESSDLYVAPEQIAERLIEVIGLPVHVGEGTRVRVSASIGIASGDRETPDELLRDADLALYAAKAAGKNQYRFFEEAMQVAAADRYRLEVDLESALARGELFLLYQPTFDLQRDTVNGVEALLRWEHPDRGVIGPEVFIPLAEDGGQIIEIGAWVLEQACRQAVAWHQRDFRIGMSVNVSARQIEDPGFVGCVAEALAGSGLQARYLTLEITESVLMRDAERCVERLRGLKRLGVRIAIDDFGTGYSSLAYLRRLPVDALKIDRSFIAGISASSEAAAIMHTLVQLGRTLDLETFGEGIEETAQLERLRRERCDSGQGFLLARPLTVEAVEAFFDRAPAAG